MIESQTFYNVIQAFINEGLISDQYEKLGAQGRSIFSVSDLSKAKNLKGLLQKLL